MAATVPGDAIVIRFYVGSDVSAPEPVECERAGWPNHDAKGRKQFDNSHFATRAEAWERLEADGLARVSLLNRAVVDLTQKRAEEVERLVAAVARNEEIRAGVGAFRKDPPCSKQAPCCERWCQHNRSDSGQALWVCPRECYCHD